MKAILFSFAAVCCSLFSYSQLPAGTKLFGGAIGFNYAKTPDVSSQRKSTAIHVSPRIGKAVRDNVVRGFAASYNYQHYKEPTYNVTDQGVGLSFFKQHYLPLGKNFMVYAEGSVGGFYGWREDQLQRYGLNAGLGAGLAYNAGSKFMFTLSIPSLVNADVSYQKYKAPLTTESYSGSLSTTASFNALQFGILLRR